jgi:small subunit ribosomal protein S5
MKKGKIEKKKIIKKVKKVRKKKGIEEKAKGKKVLPKEKKEEKPLEKGEEKQTEKGFVREIEDITGHWIPKTELGRKVMNEEIKDISEIFEKGFKIREPEIIDKLIPNLQDELLLVGGHPGKGGSKKRTGLRFTTRMHKSGRKRGLHALVAVGNNNGLIGLGYVTGKNARTAIEKAAKQAKLNLISIRRGCGSWECGCNTPHSIPFKSTGKSGSVIVEIMPAPRGIKLAVSNEIRKIIKLTGVEDLWIKSRGKTGTRLNFVFATFNALKNLNKMKIGEKDSKCVGMKEGVI